MEKNSDPRKVHLKRVESQMERTLERGKKKKEEDFLDLLSTNMAEDNWGTWSAASPPGVAAPTMPATSGPSKSGKSTALVSMILEQYRGCFERIIIFSPSINVDDSWKPVKKYVEKVMKVPTDRGLLRGLG